jgi:hypothetical protein
MLRSLFYVCLPCCVGQSLAQSVIINEMSQGASGGQEWVELLVLEDDVDLQGCEIGDADDGNWHSIATFTSHADWLSVARGTIIVIYNSGDVDAMITAKGGEDTDFADKSVIIPVNDTDFFIEDGPWGLTGGAFSNSDLDDCAAIRDDADVIIHDLAGSHPVPTISGPGSGEVIFFTGNSTSLLLDPDFWQTTASSSATPGTGNGGDNSNWIDTSLPVRLGHFQARSSNAQVQLQWATESEIENQGFIVERKNTRHAEPVEAWTEIAHFSKNSDLLGQGSTTAKTEYSYIDKTVQVGESYSYRLSDVDYRGYVTTHPSVSVIVRAFDQDLKPAALTLFPAYPNPFNPQIQLSFGLEESVNELSFEVYDIQGVLVQTLSSGAHQAGSHAFRWSGIDRSGKQMGSGIYLVRLASAGDVQIQRITLLR